MHYIAAICDKKLTGAKLGYRITSRFEGNVAATPVVPKEEIQEMIRKTIMAEMRAKMRAGRVVEGKEAAVVSQKAEAPKEFAPDLPDSMPFGRVSTDLVKIVD